jgi:hypothetical protein
MQNSNENHFWSIDDKLDKLERNIRRVAMSPFPLQMQQTLQTGRNTASRN